MANATLALFMPWWAGAALMLLGAALFLLGHLQRGREFDITRLPLTSAAMKQFWGAALLLLGASQALPPFFG